MIEKILQQLDLLDLIYAREQFSDFIKNNNKYHNLDEPGVK